MAKLLFHKVCQPVFSIHFFRFVMYLFQRTMHIFTAPNGPDLSVDSARDGPEYKHQLLGSNMFPHPNDSQTFLYDIWRFPKIGGHGFSMINHPFSLSGSPIYGNPHMFSRGKGAEGLKLISLWSQDPAFSPLFFSARKLILFAPFSPENKEKCFERGFTHLWESLGVFFIRTRTEINF